MGANAVTTVYDFTAGQVLTAVQMDNVNCGIPVFATTTTRDAAFGGTGEKVLAEGQFAYIEASDELQYYSGSAWIATGGGTWSSYTPTLGNATLGNGTLTGKYAQVGKTVFTRILLVLGSTTSLTGAGLSVTLPVTAAASSAIWGNTRVNDASPAASYLGTIDLFSTTAVYPVVFNVSATYATTTGFTTNTPITWATNDEFYVWLTYEAA